MIFDKFFHRISDTIKNSSESDNPKYQIFNFKNLQYKNFKSQGFNHYNKKYKNSDHFNSNANYNNLNSEGDKIYANSIAYLDFYDNVEWSKRNYQSFCKQGYISNVIVHRCISMITRSAASVKLQLFRERNYKKTEIQKHKIIDILNSPNRFQDQMSFFEAVYTSKLISGNAFILLVRGQNIENIDGVTANLDDIASLSGLGNRSSDNRNSLGSNMSRNHRSKIQSNNIAQNPDRIGNGERNRNQVTQLINLRPDRVNIIANKSGEVIGYRLYQGEKTIDYPVNNDMRYPDIIHLKYFHPLDDYYGLSPLEAAAYSIDLHNTALKWNQGLLQNSARPGGALVIKSNNNELLTEEQYQRLKMQINESYSGAINSGKPILLEGGLEWKEMSLSPKDMDFIEGKNSAARDIAQSLGVPPQLLGIPGDNTYSNMAEARLALWEQTILPLINSTLSALNSHFTPCFGNNLKIAYDQNAIPAMAIKQEKIWNRVKDADFLTRAEKCREVGVAYKRENEG